MRKLMTGFAVIGLVGLATPAHAQAWIGLMVGDMMARQAAAVKEQACMTGTAMEGEKIEDARAPADAVMRAYWQSVKGGQATTVSAHFHLDKRTRWASGDTVRDMAGTASVVDDFAAAGLTPDAAPLGFFRAGDGQSAAGQWVVRDAGGKRRGTYKAMFDRKAGVWKLQTLDLIGENIWVDPLVQYCHKPGDVLPYRLSNSSWMRDYTEKRAIKGEAKAAALEAEAAKLQSAAASAKPGARATKEAAAKFATEKASQARASATLRNSAALQAAESERAAKADAKAVEEARIAGQAALAAMAP